MGAGWCLALPSLLLILLSRAGCARSALEFLADEDNGGDLSRRVMRRYDNVDYDSFVGLMGRRSPDTDAVPPFRRDLDIDDIFVGLLGRRSSDPDISPWKGERRPKFIMKNGKFRPQPGM